MTETSYEFKRAITRRPAHSIVDGLRAVDHGDPDHAQMLRDHAHYVATLREAGAEIVELPALEAFPDSVFVEDVALCLREGAIETAAVLAAHDPNEAAAAAGLLVADCTPSPWLTSPKVRLEPGLPTAASPNIS